MFLPSINTSEDDGHPREPLQQQHYSAARTEVVQPCIDPVEEFTNEMLHIGSQLIARLMDCNDHLKLFPSDQDALEALHGALGDLSSIARAHQLLALAGFAQQVEELLRSAGPMRFSLETTEILQACIDLMSWQLELAAPCTGELELDTAEQARLTHRLGNHVGQPAFPAHPD